MSDPKLNALLDEGLEILSNLDASIRKHGNYSPEATCTFIDQAGQCFREASRALDALPQEPAPEPVKFPTAFCQPDDPDNSTAFSWPGTARSAKHTMALYAAPVPPVAPVVGENAEAAREALRELANVKMDLSLEDWCRISNTILAALSASSVAKPASGQTDLPVAGEREGVDYLRGQIGEILVLELNADEGSRALSQAVERILALSALSHPAQGWRDMDSAPKDGSKFDVWVPDAFGGRRMTGLSFNSKGQLRQNGLLTPADLPRWPTHWMPLPSSPAGGSGNE